MAPMAEYERRLSLLEKIIIHGNGKPSLTTQLAVLDQDVKVVKDDVKGIVELVSEHTKKDEVDHATLQQTLGDIKYTVESLKAAKDRDDSRWWSKHLGTNHGIWIIFSVFVAQVLATLVNYFVK